MELARIKDFVWQNTDRLSQWIQAGSILGAAIWAVLTFSETQKPSLAVRCSVGSSLEMSRDTRTGQDACASRFTVSVTNEGVTPFDVATILRQAWRIAPPNWNSGEILRFANPGDTMRYVDLAAWESKGTRVLSDSLTLGLPRRFFASDGYHQTYTFFLGQQWDPNWYLFRADVLSNANFVTDADKKNIGFATGWTEGLCAPQ